MTSFTSLQQQADKYDVVCLNICNDNHARDKIQYSQKSIYNFRYLTHEVHFYLFRSMVNYI